MRIAVCFFGITRSLRHTFPSIKANVIDPARQLGDVRVYSHFFRQIEVVNPRNGEIGRNDPDEYQLLRSDCVDLEEPEVCLAQWDFEGLKRRGDFWNNDFVSLRNLVHQLHSLRCVTQAALADLPENEPLITLFCRPDLRYHDSLASPIALALAAKGDLVLLPRWQSYTGMNDRFAICLGQRATSIYGTRIEAAQLYCEAAGGPLHSERLLYYALTRSGIPVHKIKARASRVRVDGKEPWEDFHAPMVSRLRNRIHAIIRKRKTSS